MKAVVSRKAGKPEVLGTDYAGTVESVGKAVIGFKVGDQVFGARKGAFAEYVSIPETGPVVRKPSAVTFEQAAAVPVAGLTALQAVQDHGRVREGQRVLVNGASGGVGTFAVQISKALGALVTGVCSPQNIETALAIGADRVIDYTKEDFTRRGERYDLAIDIAGSHSWSKFRRVLEPKGTFVAVGLAAIQHSPGGVGKSLRHLLGVRLASLTGGPRSASFIAKLNKQGLAFLGDLMAAGKIRSVIDRQYELKQVHEAMAYMDQGHARGKVVIRL